MKSIIRIFLSACFLSLFTIACKKNENFQSKSTLTLSNEIVQIGEPLAVASNAAGTNLVTKWSVSPSGESWISPSDNKSVIIFSGAGNYTITATYFTNSSAVTPYDSSSSTVVVKDNIYGDGMAHCLAIALAPINTNDQITLTPVSYTDSALVLLVHTQQLYGANYPSLGNNELTDKESEGYNFSFSSVYQYPCNGATFAPVPATGILSFKGLSNGIHKIAFSLNGNNYTGSVTVTDTDCTFTWNDASGIIISPLHILKH